MKTGTDPWQGFTNPMNYFEGLRTPYPCPVDNLLAFVRKTGKELTGGQEKEQLHHRWVWVLCRSGQAVNVIEGNAYPLQPGEMILIPARAPHYHQADAQAELDWCFLTFESDVAIWKDRIAKRVLHPPESAAAHFASAVWALKENNAAVSALQLSLFHEALLKKSPPAESPEDRWLARIRDWALQQENDTSIKELALNVRSSESHLRFQFKQRTGLSLGRYLLHIRMVRAAEWLKNTRLPITEVAYRSGYGSPGNFSRAFRREMGASPQTYRRSLTD